MDKVWWERYVVEVKVMFCGEFLMFSVNLFGIKMVCIEYYRNLGGGVVFLVIVRGVK